MEVNYLAILVATIAAAVLGMVWYSPALFGKAWMKLVGMSQKDLEAAKKQGMAKNMAINFVATFVMAWVFFHFAAGWFQGQEEMSAMAVSLHTGFWIWLGFFATSMLGMVLWEKRPFKLYLINTFYQLANLLLMGAIIGYWL